MIFFNTRWQCILKHVLDPEYQRLCLHSTALRLCNAIVVSDKHILHVPISASSDTVFPFEVSSHVTIIIILLYNTALQQYHISQLILQILTLRRPFYLSVTREFSDAFILYHIKRWIYIFHTKTSATLILSQRTLVHKSGKRIIKTRHILPCRERVVCIQLPQPVPRQNV
jgi:hypothetical protein